jgi:hypothetical protein
MLITLCNEALREEVVNRLRKVVRMTASRIDSVSPVITFVLLVAGVMACSSPVQGPRTYFLGTACPLRAR